MRIGQAALNAQASGSVVPASSGFGDILGNIAGGFLSGGTSLIPGIMGAIGGLFGQTSKQERIIPGATATGLAGEQAVLQNLSEWQKYVNAGPGQQDITAGLGSQRGLADMLQQYAQGGFLPGQQDWQTASQFSSRAFQPQEVALNQAFGESQQRTAQLAAQLGRPINDPILQAKLAQERSQGMERLGASRSAYEAEFAQNLPMQRLGFMGQLADVRGQLANQAMANRQALVSAGSNLEQISNQFRLGSAGLSTTQGGGIRDMITGGFAGYGAGLQNQAMSEKMAFDRQRYKKALESKDTPYVSGGGFGGGMQPQVFNIPTSFPMMRPTDLEMQRYNPSTNLMSLLSNIGVQGNMSNFGFNPGNNGFPMLPTLTPNETSVRDFWSQRARSYGLGGL